MYLHPFHLRSGIFCSLFSIFNDESTYMRWGQGFPDSPDRWWAFILDGKQPGVATVWCISAPSF